MSAKNDTKVTVKTEEGAKTTTKKLHSIKIAPKVTEKAYGLSTKRQYIFTAPIGASRQLIAENVEDQFSVTVTGIKVLRRKGKAVRVNRGKHRYPATVFRPDVKLAYVTLKEGDKLDIFAEKEAEADGKTDQVADKKAEVAGTTSDATVKTKKAGLFVRRRTGNRGDK